MRKESEGKRNLVVLPGVGSRVVGNRLSRWRGCDIDTLIETNEVSGWDQLRAQMEVSGEHQSGVQREVRRIRL